MTEKWIDVAGYEGRYQVSNTGALRSVSFMQRYLLRNGAEAFRSVKARSLAQQMINSGYLLAHFHLNNTRTAMLVHRVVATAFVPNPLGLREVNHINGDKTDNRAENLEWVTSKANHTHAVSIGLQPQAIRVAHPDTGEIFHSITHAAKACRMSHRRVRADFLKVGA